jgi:branched-chain amino acid transport system substrate-binding protein
VAGSSPFPAPRRDSTWASRVHPARRDDFNATINRFQEAKAGRPHVLPVGGPTSTSTGSSLPAGLKNKIPIISTTFGFGNEHIVLDAKEVEGLVACYPYFATLDNAPTGPSRRA